MKDMGIVRACRRIFGDRTLFHHRGGANSLRFEDGPTAYVIVTDPSLSLALLKDTRFAAINTFDVAYAQLIESGHDLNAIRAFFRQSPLMLEGKSHKDARARLGKALAKMLSALPGQETAIDAIIAERQNDIRDPYSFAQTFVQASFARLIHATTGIGPETIDAALAARRNVFDYYLNPGGHIATSRSLAMLDGDRDRAPEDDAELSLLAAKSLIVNGVDPLTAIVCAHLHAASPSGWCKQGAMRYPAVSSVTRQATETTTMQGTTFRAGDICILSLLPPSGDAAAEPHPFGAGRHVCSGKALSLALLDLAERIAARRFPGGFPEPAALAPNGAFLGFGSCPANSPDHPPDRSTDARPFP